MTGVRVLIVDDEAVIRRGLCRVMEGRGYQAEASESGFGAIEKLQKTPFNIVITDLKMPGMDGIEVLKAIKILQPDVPVIIITGYSTVDTAVDAMKNGAFDYISKPFTPEQMIEMVEKALEQRTVQLQRGHPAVGPSQAGFDIFVGESEAMQRVYNRIKQVAPTDSTVLITGQSGTGKELVARAIHENSMRCDKPFVAVDCTSLVENLLESELFGHVKGSFTGAVQTKMGLFKVADGGTLFLDEISNISLATQGKLLRVLQEFTITPIGGTKPISIDIRLITATNRDLSDLVDEGLFRKDLFFRLNIIPVHLPPLIEREGDLPLLIGHFLKKFSGEIDKEIHGVSPAAMSILAQHPFTGNVRELENIIERAVVLTHSKLIQPEDLEIEATTDGLPETMTESIPQSAESLKEAKRKVREKAVGPVERAFLIQALERSNWNVTRAARDVGMLRPNFQAMLKKQGISVRDHSE
ncbi:MAG: sigma-54-dependent Fis family transcriptional regulator [Deltaproteobacteria bacterium]|nr:sigma-54-dependent Fis family transcriptional regulator [Candidatus Anaeroferrophillus wilburensis]MBN2889785.1 sigma-54-dependent Fis family transcriptional regulator [Deltaproteobacteria bacterium]